MFSQIAMFSTAETGSIGSGSDRDDHVSRRRVVGHACCLEVCKTSRLFRKENEHTACAVPVGTNFLRSGKFQKDLILLELAVIAASCFEVCKTSRFSAKKTACHFLHCAKSNIKSTRDSVLRPRFKALPEKILAELSGNTSRTRFFAQNGGEKALNRCEVPALQREDLERTAKEQRRSLVDSRLWLGANLRCRLRKFASFEDSKMACSNRQCFGCEKDLLF